MLLFREGARTGTVGSEKLNFHVMPTVVDHSLSGGQPVLRRWVPEGEQREEGLSPIGRHLPPALASPERERNREGGETEEGRQSAWWGMSCARPVGATGQTEGRKQKCWQRKGQRESRVCLGLKSESCSLSAGCTGEGGSDEAGFYHL